MHTLYYAPGTAALVVHWLLIEADAPHQLVKLDLAAGEHKRPEYLALNPNGVVPTLVTDGVPAFEAAALALGIAEAYPAAGLAPPPSSPQRMAYYQWMLHLAHALQPAFRTWFYPAEAAGEACADAAKDAARVRIEAAWDRFDAHFADGRATLLGGEGPTAPDFMLCMLMRWSRNMPRPATAWPHLAAFAARMKARPSFATLYAREGLTEWA